MKYNVWLDFKKDILLKTGDLILIQKGRNKEIAFIDSGVIYGGPTRISSIPEAWSYNFDCYIHPRIEEIFYDSDNPDINNCFIKLNTTKLRNYKKEYCFTIKKYMRIKYE